MTGNSVTRDTQQQTNCCNACNARNAENEMTLMQTKAAEAERENLEAARIILADIERYGGEADWWSEYEQAPER